MRYFETRKARIDIIPMIDIMLFLLVDDPHLRSHQQTAHEFDLRENATPQTVD